VPALWHAADTTPQDRQAIGRVVVERVTVDVHEDSAQVDVTIHWAGGVPSAHGLRRPVVRYAQRAKVTALVARIDGLRQAGHRLAHIAEHWHRAGCYPPQRTERCTGESVARLLSRRGSAGTGPPAVATFSFSRPATA